ncbi:MAG: hypothetical protein EPN86_06495 [Nanoarchaeota archaeon]|nr:MAG: hypothetical protein EPN86_06495 [Nanoarchaeota archaeon]
MNAKIIAGIFLPVAIIIILVALSASDVGKSVEKKTADSVKFSNIFTAYTDYSDRFQYVPIRTVTIVNNFFMPRVQELNDVVVCAVNDNNNIARLTFQVRYSETKYQDNIYTMQPMMLESSRMMGGYYGGSSGRASVNMPVHSAKTVTLFIEPQRVYQNAQGLINLNQYKGYTKLLVVDNPKSTGYYASCDNIPADELAKAAVIPITDQGSAPIIIPIGSK